MEFFFALNYFICPTIDVLIMNELGEISEIQHKKKNCGARTRNEVRLSACRLCLELRIFQRSEEYECKQIAVDYTTRQTKRRPMKFKQLKNQIYAMLSLAEDSENGNFWFYSLDSLALGGWMMLTNQIHKLNCANQTIFGVSISLSDGMHTELSVDAAAAKQIYPTEKHTQQVYAIHSMCVRIYGDDDDDSGGGGDGGDNSGGNGG